MCRYLGSSCFKYTRAQLYLPYKPVISELHERYIFVHVSHNSVTTDNSPCKQQKRACFENRSQSKPVCKLRLPVLMRWYCGIACGPTQGSAPTPGHRGQYHVGGRPLRSSTVGTARKVTTVIARLGLCPGGCQGRWPRPVRSRSDKQRPLFHLPVSTVLARLRCGERLSCKGR